MGAGFTISAEIDGHKVTIVQLTQAKGSGTGPTPLQMLLFAIGAWGWLGIVPLLTWLFNFYPLYSVLGIKTCILQPILDHRTPLGFMILAKPLA